MNIFTIKVDVKSYNVGNALLGLKRYDEAISMYD